MKRAVPILLLALAACAQPTTQRPAVQSQATDEETRTQLAMALDRQMDMLEQLSRVNYRLAVAAADLCGDNVGPAIGAFLRTKASFAEQSRAAALARYPGLSDAPTVVYVAPGSTAAAAGLAPNDVMTAVDGEPVPTTGKPIDGYYALFRKAAAAGPVRLSIERGGAPREVAVEPQSACSYPPFLINRPEVNAATNGKVIYVFRGMMDFIHSDDELALVLGHEMAHDFRGHLAAKEKNATVGKVVGTVFDVLVGAVTGVVSNTFGNMGGRLTAGAFSQEFEAEADYVGLYVMARAGYDFHDAVNFWRRMAVNSPGAITMVSDHPATSERFVALQAAIKEIDAKVAQGQPLVPNEQGSAATTATAAKE